MRKTTFKLRLPNLLLLSAAVFLFLYSCKNDTAQLNILSEEIEIHQDSIHQVFFIPTKENLKSELIFYHEILSNLENFLLSKSDSIRYDSLKTILENQIIKTKNWTTDLNNYNLQEIIEEQFSKEVFSEKKYLSLIPLFYESGKAVLKKENLTEFDFHIQKQIEIYWFLKNEFGENEEAQIAVKDFIGFLNSIRLERKNTFRE